MSNLDTEFKLPFLGEPLDSISTLSSRYDMSEYKVKKYINKLIDYGILEKFGNRFHVISIDVDDSVQATQMRLLNKAKILLRIVKYKNNPDYVFYKSNVCFYIKHLPPEYQSIKYSPILDIETRHERF